MNVFQAFYVVVLLLLIVIIIIVVVDGDVVLLRHQLSVIYDGSCLFLSVLVL